MVDVSEELLISGGRIDIDGDLSGKGVFSLGLKGGRLQLKASSWIGVAQLNSRVTVEIRPKVPIGNLEALLDASGAPRHIVLSGLRSYSAGDALGDTFVDLISQRFVELLQEIRLVGFELRYRSMRTVGTSVSGSVLPFETAVVGSVRGPAFAVSEHWERTPDTPANRILRLALHKLLAVYRVLVGRKDARRVLSLLAVEDLAFGRIGLPPANLTEANFAQATAKDFEYPRQAYNEALQLAKLILSGGGISLGSSSGSLRLPPILVNMEDAFEAYLRAELSMRARGDGIEVIDGSKEHPSGQGRVRLYERGEATTISNPPTAEPDIVLFRVADGASLIIDAKYKPLDQLPSRDDVEQVLTYALRYGVKRVALAYPSRRGAETNVAEVGEVGGVTVSVIRVSLADRDLSAEMDRVYGALIQTFFA